MYIASLCAFGLAGLLAVAFGIRYLAAREFMPYQAVVLGKPWSALEPRLQAIILGMLRVEGGGLLGCGAAMLWLLWPLLRGEVWAAWAALTIYAVTTVPILVVVLHLRRIAPGAPTPVAPAVAAIALVVVGALAFFLG